MFQNKVLNVVGLLAPVAIAPVIAFLPSVTLGTVFTLEHSSGALLYSLGLVAFLLLATRRGDDLLTVLFCSCLFIIGLMAFVLRGGLLYCLAIPVPPDSPAKAGLSGTKVLMVVMVYLALTGFYLHYLLSEPRRKTSETDRIDGWAEENREQ